MEESWLYTTCGSSRQQYEEDTRGLTQSEALALAVAHERDTRLAEPGGVHITTYEEQNDHSDVPLNRF